MQLNINNPNFLIMQGRITKVSMIANRAFSVLLYAYMRPAHTGIESVELVSAKHTSMVLTVSPNRSST